MTNSATLATQNPPSNISEKPKLPILILLGILFGLFGAAWVIGIFRAPLVVDVGGTDRLDLIYLETGAGGFFQPEKQELDSQEPPRDNTYRWTGKIGYIKMPYEVYAMPVKITIRATAPRANVPPDKSATKLIVGLEKNGKFTRYQEFPITGEYEGKDYELIVPLNAYRRPTLEPMLLRMEIENPFQPGGGDTRNLGMIVFNLKLEPHLAVSNAYSFLYTTLRPFELVAITFSIWLIAWSIAKGWGMSLILAAGSALTLLASMLFWAVEADPYYAEWAIIFTAGALLSGLAIRFTAKTKTLAPAFVWAATLYLIMPIAQVAFGRLNLFSLSTGSVTFWAFLVMGLVCTFFSFRSNNFDRIFTLTFLTAAGISFGFWLIFVFATDLYRGADFKVYYNALVAYQKGSFLYNFDQLINLPGQAVRMPPVFAPVLWGFAVIFGSDNQSALLVWRILNTLLLIPTVWVLIKTFRPAQPRPRGEGQGESLQSHDSNLNQTPTVLFLGLAFAQNAETIAYGQFNIIVLLGMALMGLWIKQGKFFSSGTALALPIGLKLYPLMSAFYYFFGQTTRKANQVTPKCVENSENRATRPSKFVTGYRSLVSGLGGLVAGGAVLILLSGLAAGFDNVWLYLSQVVWKVNKPEMDISNQSLFGFFARLDTAQVVSDYKGTFSAWVTTAGYGGALICTLLTFWVIWRGKSPQPSWENEQLKLGALALLALVIPPFVWLHYSVAAIAAIIALAVVLDRQKRHYLLLFAVAYAMLGYGGRNDFFFTEAVGLARIGSSYRFLAVTALWLFTLYLIWQQGKTQNANQS
jgi:hypothetical protein